MRTLKQGDPQEIRQKCRRTLIAKQQGFRLVETSEPGIYKKIFIRVPGTLLRKAEAGVSWAFILAIILLAFVIWQAYQEKLAHIVVKTVDGQITSLRDEITARDVYFEGDKIFDTDSGEYLGERLPSK